MAPVLDRLAGQGVLDVGVGDRLGQCLHPREFDDLGAEIERGDADRMLIGRQVAQRENVIGDRGIDLEFAVGMAKRRLLRLDAALPQKRIHVEHLVGRLVDDLPREQVFDRRRKVVHLEALPPAAVDVIKHPLQRPEAPEQAVRGIRVDAALLHRRDDVFHRRRAALGLARGDQFAREGFPW